MNNTYKIHEDKTVFLFEFSVCFMNSMLTNVETNNSDPELEIPQFWLETPFLVDFNLLHTSF